MCCLFNFLFDIPSIRLRENHNKMWITFLQDKVINSLKRASPTNSQAVCKILWKTVDYVHNS